MPQDSPPRQEGDEQEPEWISERRAVTNRYLELLDRYLGDWSSRNAANNDARDSLLKIVAIGNGAGLLATTGIIGTIIARSTNGTFPLGFWFTAILFLVGLAACLVGYFAEALAAREAWRANLDHPVAGTWASHGPLSEQDALQMATADIRRVYRWQRTVVWVTYAGLGMLGGAVVFGFAILLTRAI